MEVLCKIPFVGSTGNVATLDNLFLPVDGCIPCILRGFASHGGDLYTIAKIYKDHWASYLSEADFLVINIPDNVLSVDPQKVVPEIRTELHESSLLVSGVEIHKR